MMRLHTDSILAVSVEGRQVNAMIEDLERQRDRLRSQFAELGDLRPGSLVARYRKRGSTGCHCAQEGDPGHGPSWSLTRAVKGKTRTRVIPAHAAGHTQALVAEYQRFRQLSKEFVEVSDALSEARLTAGVEAKTSVLGDRDIAGGRSGLRDRPAIGAGRGADAERLRGSRDDGAHRRAGPGGSSPQRLGAGNRKKGFHHAMGPDPPAPRA